MIFKKPFCNIIFWFNWNLHQSLYYIYWIFKIVQKKYISYNVKSINYYLWKRLTKFQIYPKDIRYYYRLYYATNNLTWFYSLKKQRKLVRLKVFNYTKFSTVLWLKKTIKKHLNYDFFLHRILMHKRIFRQINFFLYYKQTQLKKFFKTKRNYDKRFSFFYKHKFLKLFNRIRMIYEKPLFNVYKKNLLRIFKETRQTHWTATHKETLNKRTYCNFLPNFIKNQTFFVKTALILILQQIKLTYSWKHSILLVNLFFFNYSKNTINIYKGLILQFPKNGIITNYKKINKFKSFKRLWEQRKRQYLFIQSKRQLWMKKKKNFYKKIDYNFNQFSFLQGYYHYDIYTNSLCFLQNIKWNLFILNMRQFSYVLKITKWRFKA